jgi:predicted nucleotidyltransferase
VHAHGERDNNFYELTPKGHALRMATARKPIKRATAEQMVREFVERVEYANRDPDLLLWIDEVVVFGSFVGTAPKLSDIDWAVTYTPRIEDSDAWQEMMFARVRLAQANGRYFRSFLDKLGWPQREIELHLRKGLPAIHIHDLREEGSFIRTIPSKQLYVRPQRGLVICPKCKHWLRPKLQESQIRLSESRVTTKSQLGANRVHSVNNVIRRTMKKLNEMRKAA